MFSEIKVVTYPWRMYRGNWKLRCLYIRALSVASLPSHFLSFQEELAIRKHMTCFLHYNSNVKADWSVEQNSAIYPRETPHFKTRSSPPPKIALQFGKNWVGSSYPFCCFIVFTSAVSIARAFGHSILGSFLQYPYPLQVQTPPFHL